MSTTKTRTATDAYFEKVFAIGEQLDEIRKLVAADISRPPAPERNWANVGDMGHVSEQLDEIIKFLS